VFGLGLHRFLKIFWII